MKRRLLNIFLILAMTFSFSATALAGESDLTPVTASPVIGAEASAGGTEKNAPEAGIQALQRVIASDLESVSVIVTFDESVDEKALEAVSGGEVVYDYSLVFNGVSMVVAGDKVDSVAKLDGVTGVYFVQLMQLDT